MNQDYFAGILAKAMKERRRRNSLVTTEHDPYPVPEWVVFERNTLLAAIRRFRDVEVSDILRIEAQAVGHSDYARKLALYASWLAEGARGEKLRGLADAAGTPPTPLATTRRPR